MASFQRIQISELVASGEVELKTGPFGTQLKASEYTDVGTPVINVRNIGFGDIRPENLEFISAHPTFEWVAGAGYRCNPPQWK